jgi:hypothetical protein
MRQDGRQETEDRRGRAAVIFFCLLSFAPCLLATGCSSTKETSTYDRQQEALKDPFGYNPDLKKSGSSVTGDGDKDALQRDVDHVLNP